MDISAALTESGVRLVAFHDAFNRNVKVTFGALEAVNGLAEEGAAVVALPTGGEPWGKETLWRTLDNPVKDAARFLAEMGIARAAAAFEDYLVGAKAEFDRAGLLEAQPKANGTSALQGLDSIFGLDSGSLDDETRLATFFDVARNCVVHRSNRASDELFRLRRDEGLASTLERWPKRVGRWSVALPDIEKDTVVDWRPRHAIMASDVYYRCAMKLDRRLVQLLGPRGLTGMAAHWCFFADPPAPCLAKLDAGTMVRSQLTSRYGVRSVDAASVILELRKSERWDDVRRAFERMYPDGPQSSLARKRRARAKKSLRK